VPILGVKTWGIQRTSSGKKEVDFFASSSAGPSHHRTKANVGRSAFEIARLGTASLSKN
jgi:hypothetical protein